MLDKFFRVVHCSKKSKARVGEIATAHGKTKTPCFFTAATKGTVKAIPANLLKEIGSQVVFVNTYHLVTHPGADVIAASGGIHKFANLNLPIMSDSGGFQVFSLASQKRKANIRGDEQPTVVKISDKGVKFRSIYDGKTIELTPEASIEHQMKIGADILIAFDECADYPVTHKYAEKAMERTHRWLTRCVSQAQSSNFKTQNYKRYLYGVIQGGTFEDLRKKSAAFVTSQPVDGVAIGGVANGRESKQEMRNEIKWVSPYLPKDKPVHFLGIGHFDDFIDAIKYGVDTFDCVEPTRLARMGRIFSWQQILSQFFPPASAPSYERTRKMRAVGIPSNCATCCQYNNCEVDITRTIYKTDLSPIDKSCNCYVCENFTKAYLHHLFKQREILGYTLATYHNLYVVNKFFDVVREMIANDTI